MDHFSTCMYFYRGRWCNCFKSDEEEEEEEEEGEGRGLGEERRRRGSNGIEKTMPYETQIHYSFHFFKFQTGTFQYSTVHNRRAISFFLYNLFSNLFHPHTSYPASVSLRPYATSTRRRKSKIKTHPPLLFPHVERIFFRKGPSSIFLAEQLAWDGREEKNGTPLV